MKEFIISPPFGSLLVHHKCTSVLGTYTLNRRGGWPKKLYRGILTIRPIKDGWINSIGLQNPGIKSIKKFDSSKIYSIAAVEFDDWEKLLEYIPSEITVEVNVSCPNIKHFVEMSDDQVSKYLNKFKKVIFKLSPTDKFFHQVEKLISLGAVYLHIANTIPTHQGGESGERLKQFSLGAIKRVRSDYPHVRIVGGGGIYSLKDVHLYKEAGADYFSLASIWFNPFKGFKLLKRYKK